MGTHKKEANRRQREGKTKDGNVKVKGENFYRSAKKIKTLNMFKDGKPQRNAAGEITQAASYQSPVAPMARIEPNRKWFNSTRVISQDALEKFRSAVQAHASDPTTYLMKRNKLPMSLIEEKKGRNINGLKEHAAKIAIESQPFSNTFGQKAQRKRPKLDFSSLEDLAGRTEHMHEGYLERLEQANQLSASGDADAGSDDGTFSMARESIFSKGTSKRIWNELYKVIDSSDVVLHVLDARDPIGTRCDRVLKYIREEAPHKHTVFVLNKVDLVPSKVAAAWVRSLSTEFPTLAFHASINNSFGKGSLISLLRQFSTLHSDRKQISVGLIGYPNTGKSSIINTLRSKRVCTVAPIAGETKVWQYVTLMKRIYLIDCPGVVPPSQNDSDETLLLRGAIRAENIQLASQYIDAILKRVQSKHLQRTYEIPVDEKTDATTFLQHLARKSGRLMKGGEPDLDGCAKIVINDWIRGKIPWFTPPPKKEGEVNETVKGVDGREGRFGEMPSRKRKRDGESDGTRSEPFATEQTTLTDSDEAEGEGDDGDEFEGFDEDEGLELDVDADRSAEGEDEGLDSSLRPESDASEDEDIGEEVLAISNALASAKRDAKGK